MLTSPKIVDSTLVPFQCRWKVFINVIQEPDSQELRLKSDGVLISTLVSCDVVWRVSAAQDPGINLSDSPCSSV